MPRMSSRLCLVLAAATAASAKVDDWLLAGHGVGARAAFSSSAKGWLLPMPTPPPSVGACTQLSFYTPFSGATAQAGMAARGAAAPGGAQLALPLICGPARTPFVWTVSPAGATVAFDAVEARSWDSYLIYLPDGTLLAGINGSALLALDSTTLDLVWTAAPAALSGGGGAQVLAVSKPTGPQHLPQLQTAGGTGGPNWWGAACDLNSASPSSPSTPFTGCAGNADSTVNMGADGLSFYNNQRFEDPPGIVRYTSPMSSASAPEAFNTGEQQWPWLIRSLAAGDVINVEETALNRWSGGAGHARLWTAAVASAFPATLLITDDETRVVVANSTHAASFDASTGAPVAVVDFAAGGGAGTTCSAMDSPWMLPRPAVTPGGVLTLLCKPAGAATWAVFSADIETGAMSGAAKLAITADQAIYDRSGNVYVVGTGADGGVAMQKIAAPAAP